MRETGTKLQLPAVPPAAVFLELEIKIHQLDNTDKT